MDNIRDFIIIAVILVLNLAVTYYLKYHNAGLPLSQFSIYKIGNIFNALIIGITLVGFAVYAFTNHPSKVIHIRILLSIEVLLLIMLVVLLILSKINVTYPERFVFNYTFEKVLVGFLFISSWVGQIYVLATVWSLVLDPVYSVYLKAMVVTIVTVLFVLGASFVYISFGNSYDKDEIDKNGKNLGVVLGAAVWRHDEPSPLFKGRIEKGYELYKKGYVGTLQLTGSNAPGEVSEAEAALLYLAELGEFREIDILIETGTTTTSEQARFIYYELAGSKKNNKIIVISDYFHLKRVLEMCNFYGVKAYGVGSDYKLNWEKELFYRFRESLAIVLFWFFAF